jgi:DNA-binding NarL/FixJ family response regulator
MPVMSGLEAAPILKRVLPKTPIILLTLFGDQLKTIDLTRTGISATFAKSDSIDQLIHKANELVTAAKS